MSVPLCEHKYAHLYKRVHVCDCVPLCKCVHSCPSFGKQMEASRDLPYSLLLGHILPLSQNWVWSCGHYCYLWPLAGFFSPLTTADTSPPMGHSEVHLGPVSLMSGYPILIGQDSVLTLTNVITSW